MSRHSPSRRLFFKTLAIGASLPGTAAALGRLAALPASSPSSDYWQMVREHFPFTEEQVPMNAANLCPSPRPVADRVTELTRDIDRDCSFQNRARFETWLEEARSKIALQIGAHPDEIALVRNTSEANCVVNNGLSLKGGDEVVVWDQNHPTNNVAWDVRAARFGFRVRRVSTTARPRSEEELLNPFLAAFTEKTRVLAVTHVSNVSGVKLPLRSLCRAAHRQNIFVHIDGAQTWGSLKLNLQEMGCDSYAASAHKWFMGPKEAGLLYVRSDRIPQVWPAVVAPGWGADVDPDVTGARKFESLGQRDDACLAALGTTAHFHDLIGTERIESRIYELAARLKSGLQQLGLPLVTPAESQFSAGVCIFEVPPERREEIFNRLYEEFGIAGAPVAGIRLCPHIYNTDAHIERALDAIRRIV